ncbi:hypothetical protein SARC_02315 [Sphaeroforma arctica JP610]|uniref:Uncharacterized protein n=1 Tax=Sphaeroforma arctica JP610 TaxID=667725 RepID=A0A0L0G9C1_9EUKA|nr:hypothetical protein SARC_02315 [Sphaeroforma arctica JP610]KNC85514.1 hypothetical protein SARC_02315 [Sphaeroforma arctica JP610]|eukprot:XP_014159416.1 hypothetical protein SARC_02315 [Sphaeroforma arctica JP610]
MANGIAAGLPETDLDRRLSSSTVNSNHSNPNQPYAAGPIMPDLDSNLALSMGLGVGANLGLDTDMGLAATGLGVGGNLGRDSGLNVDQGVEALAVDPTNLHVGGFGGFLDMGNADWQSDFLRSYTTGANDLLANGLASTHLPSGLSTQADLALGPGAMGEVQGNEPSLLANLNDIDANTLANLNLPDLDFQSLATGFPPLDLGSNNNGLDGPLALNLPLNVDGDVGGLTGVVPNAIQPTEAMENAARISAMIQQQHMSQQMALLNDLNAHTNPSVGVGLSTMGMGNLHAQPALSEADTALYLHRDASTRTQMGGQPDQTHADESDPGTKHSVGSDPQVFRTPTHQQILLRSPLQQPPQVHPSQATNQVTQMHASFGLAQTTDYGLTQPPLNQRTPQGPHTAGHTETWGGGTGTHAQQRRYTRTRTDSTHSEPRTDPGKNTCS